MSYHQQYTNLFLHNQTEGAKATQRVMKSYGIRVKEAEVPEGTTYWKVIGVYHLSPEENNGRHNIFFEVLDENGQRVPTQWAGYTWEGRQDHEIAPPTILDKPVSEEAGNIPVQKGQIMTVWIKGGHQDASDPSDQVVNVHTDHPDEPTADGRNLNSYFHHSFYIVYQRTLKGAVVAAPEPPAVEQPVVEQPAETQPTAETTPAESIAEQPATAPAVAAPAGDFYPDYIYGLHESGGEQHMIDAGRKGWVLELAAIGLNPNDPGMPSGDFSHLSDKGIGVIVRINNGYLGAGTIPKPERYDDFAKTCAAFVKKSKGCHIWIIGNETNHHQEWPEGQKVFPSDYASVYRKCRAAIHQLPGHQNDQVLVAASAPWNLEVKYEGNPSGDWIKYFADQLAPLQAGECDGIALHTYTHDHTANTINNDFFHASMPHLRNEFRTYQQYMQAIPERFRKLPIYITETDPTTHGKGWEGGNDRGWIRTAYREIADWNKNPANQPILALILYRWPPSDQTWWTISDKSGLIDDFKNALRAEPASDYRLRAASGTNTNGRSGINTKTIDNNNENIEELPPGSATNQNIITAFSNAAKQLGLGNWDLLSRAGLSLGALVGKDNSARQNPYSGPAIDDLPNLTDQERAVVKSQLNSLVEPDVVSFSFSFSALAPDEPNQTGFLGHQTELIELPLALPDDMQLDLSSLTNSVEKRVGQTWNRYGWLMMAIADELDLDLEVAMAVITNAINRRGIAPDGRLVIRFENYAFLEFWGEQNQELFDQYFRYKAGQPWQGHQYRTTTRGKWQNVHGSQDTEWDAFETAMTLDETAAKSALAMGATKINGINYSQIGYMSVDQMFRDFSVSENDHLLGYFDLIASAARDSRQLTALQNKDFSAFAALHFGNRQAARNASTIRVAYEAAHKLKLGQA